VRRASLLAAALFLVAPLAQASTITIVNKNADPSTGQCDATFNTGFCDPAPAAPVGGNPGTTLGEQRLNVFREAARIWGELLPSAVEIKVDAQFTPLDCEETSASLGSAGPLTFYRDFPGAPQSGTWYPKALANQIAGRDLGSSLSDIRARFNSELGQSGCLTGTFFYYGLDANEPANQTNLLTTVLHELGHGLGFISLADGETGELAQGLPDVFTAFIYDNVSGESAIRPLQVAWLGSNTTAFGASFLGPLPRLLVTAPSSVAGSYAIGLASFGPSLTVAGVSGPVVQALDAADGAGPATTDACSPLTNASQIAGKIAIADRGTCTFVVKARNAQNAGALALLVADNQAGYPPIGMSGSDPTITIPAVRIAQDDGARLKAELSSGLTATLGLDASKKAGTDGAGRLLLFTPNPYSSGSSVSHFDTSATPDLLMEPYSTRNSPIQVDATLELFRDIGWFGGGGAPSYAYLLTSVARARGGGNTAFYTSDVFVANRGTSAATYTMKFLGHDADGTSGPERTFTLGAGQAATHRDVLGSAFGLSSGADYGAIRITSDSPSLKISSVTSTPPPSGPGAFGQSVPALGSSQLVAAGGSATIVGIREEDGKYRTNLALANGTTSALVVDYGLVADDGTGLGTRSVTLPPLGMTQLGRIAELITGTRAVSNATLVLSTPTANGAFAAFASLIEFHTNDPATLLPAPSGSGSATSFLAAAARSKGDGNSYFTTDFFVANRGATAATYNLKFLNHLVDGRSGPEKTFALGGGKAATYRDVLGSVFGLSSGTDYGAIRITADSSALVTSSVTSTPPVAGPGAFGQSVPGSTTAQLVTGASPATIVGIREELDVYRTNLVLANATEATLDVDVALFADGGSTLGTLRVTLQPLEMRQLNKVAATITGGSSLKNATLVLSTPTPNGAFAAFASLIEFHTNDPATLFPQ